MKLLAIGLLFLVPLVACSPSKPKAENRAGPPVLNEAVSLTLLPGAKGGIYAIDKINAGVWFVAGEKAVRVPGLPDNSFIESATQDAAGGAVLQVIQDNKSELWYLAGTKLIRVQEAPDVATP